MSGKRLKAVDVKGEKTVFRSYRIVPYPEIEEILKSGGEAFVEGIDRRTAFSAKRILSRRLKADVKAESRLIYINENKDEAVKGYLFMVDDKPARSSHA